MARDKLITKFLDESEFEQWDKFVASCSAGSIYSTAAYLDIVCRATGGAFSVLAVHKGDQLVGGVALYEEAHIYGRVVANRLLLYYNGLILKDFSLKYRSDQTSREVAVLGAIEAQLAGSSFGRVLLHNRYPITDVRPFLSAGWTAWPAYSYLVEVRDLTKAWSGIDQNLRRLIDRCRDADISFSDDDDFSSFYKLHLETHRRKGAPLYLPGKAFETYFRSLKERNLCRLFIARLRSGQPVAAQLVLLGDHPTSHTVCAAAEAEYLKLGTTPFLRWKAFEELSRLGFESNDLTDAALNSVTRFKSQLGGRLVTNLVLKRPDSFTYAWGERLTSAIKRVLRPAYHSYQRIRQHDE